MLKKILTVLIVLVVLIAVIGFLLPRHAVVKRSVAINRPASLAAVVNGWSGTTSPSTQWCQGPSGGTKPTGMVR